MQRYLIWIDRLSAWVGKSFSWLVLAMTLATTYDVTARNLFRAPTAWAYDAQYIMYGTLFMLGGAYTLSRAAHVRGDIFYKSWPVRRQATVDLILYFLFFFPGVVALISVGAQWAAMSYGFGRPPDAGLLDLFSYGEKSALSSHGPPIWPLKVAIPVAGVFMFVQGTAETIRCIQAIRTGAWPQRLTDVEETETRLIRERATET